MTTTQSKRELKAASDGTFLETIIAPFDFGINVLHNVNATQNGSGTGITNATFSIVPTMQPSPHHSQRSIKEARKSFFEF